MPERPFVDHYGVLHLSPTADTETVERVYRLLAKRYHPDNAASGDVDKFNEVHSAYEVLSNPEARAAHDVKHDQEQGLQWQIFEQGAAADDRDQDQRLFHGILSLLYVARRRDPDHGGLGPVHLERMLGTPREHLAFPLWYLKRRGFIEIIGSGLVAITVDGVDKLSSSQLALPDDRLLAESSIGEQQRGEENSGPSRTLSDHNDDGHKSKKRADPDQRGADQPGDGLGGLH